MANDTAGGEQVQALISTGEAARIIGVSRERVLAYIRDGRLRVAAQDNYGRRLLRRSDVEKFARGRHNVSVGQGSADER